MTEGKTKHSLTITQRLAALEAIKKIMADNPESTKAELASVIGVETNNLAVWLNGTSLPTGQRYHMVMDFAAKSAEDITKLLAAAVKPKQNPLAVKVFELECQVQRLENKVNMLIEAAQKIEPKRVFSDFKELKAVTSN